jgi:hypothetical protein
MNTRSQGWGYSSVVEHLPGMWEVLGVIPTGKKKTTCICSTFTRGHSHKHLCSEILFSFLFVWFYLFTYLFSEPGVWTRALHLPGRYSTTWAIPTSFCCRCLVRRISHLCLAHPGQQSSYLCFLHSWDNRHMPLCPALVEMRGSCYLFAWAGLEPWSSWSLPPK